MSRTEPSAPSLPLVMPGSVRAGQVISLVEITGGLGSKVDAPQLADEFGADIAVLLPILDCAEMLGLTRSEKGDIFLTDLGLKFQKTTKNKVRMLKDKLMQIEPFWTALELASRKRSVTSAEVAESLARRGVKWHYRPELNERIVNDLLIHWAIYADLLSYNGKTGKFQKV
ncbi:MAG: AAA-associated domain-containing protein [Nitrososphaerales archaeon]|nr:AAA-associated domain-containing protein [Nitrososphaerales archaeon]